MFEHECAYCFAAQHKKVSENFIFFGGLGVSTEPMILRGGSE
jgi:hypothetical protein